MKNRILIIFLLANFIIGLVIIINFGNKSEENKIGTKNQIITKIAEKNKNEEVTPIVTKNTLKPPEKTSLAVNGVYAVAPSDPAVCIDYGPLNIEQKSIFDTIVAKEKINNLVVVTQKKQFEIYWNLGNNQIQANEMFERQKKDALQDKKFQMTQEDGNWIVSVAIVNDSLETAKVLASQLSEKANRVNAGGKWQYKTLPDIYFYQVKNINAMTINSQSQVSTSLRIKKTPCAT